MNSKKGSVLSSPHCHKMAADVSKINNNKAPSWFAFNQTERYNNCHKFNRNPKNKPHKTKD